MKMVRRLFREVGKQWAIIYIDIILPLSKIAFTEKKESLIKEVWSSITPQFPS
jgi:hypothetical protein